MPTEFECMDKNTEKANPIIKRSGFHSTNLLRLECQLVIDIDLVVIYSVTNDLVFQSTMQFCELELIGKTLHEISVPHLFIVPQHKF